MQHDRRWGMRGELSLNKIKLPRILLLLEYMDMNGLADAPQIDSEYSGERKMTVCRTNQSPMQYPVSHLSSTAGQIRFTLLDWRSVLRARRCP